MAIKNQLLLKKKKLLYFSGYDYLNSTFIRQDVEAMSNYFEVKYISYVDFNLNSKLGINSERIVYPKSNLKSKIRWRMESFGWTFNWYDKTFANKLGNAINEFNPDIIHCQFSYESAKLIQNYKTDLPIIINFRGYGASFKLKNKKYVDWLKSVLSNKNVYSIFVSHSLKKNLMNKNIKFCNDPYILYTGVDLSLFKRKENTRRENKVFIQVGSFNDKKGQEFTIRAFKKYIDKNGRDKSKLIFIGNGKNLLKCKKLVETLKLSDLITFKGAMKQGEIINELEKSSIFVHHSITPSNGDQEGIPNSIIEAMSMKLPILSTFHSGIPEAVEHSINGLLCNEYDVETFSTQMKEIESWELLEKNRQKVKNKFNLENHINQLNGIYSQILGI